MAGFFTAGSPAFADPVTLPDLLIGVTQGFLEFTVEDYLATSQTQGRYEIEVKQLDPRLRLPGIPAAFFQARRLRGDSPDADVRYHAGFEASA